jgi:hypothetical protein
VSSIPRPEQPHSASASAVRGTGRPAMPVRPAAGPRAPTRRHLAAAAVIFVAAVLGFVLGWGFGLRAGGSWGTWLAVVTAFNGALLCSLLADWLIGRAAARPLRVGTGRGRSGSAARPV